MKFLHLFFVYEALYCVHTALGIAQQHSDHNVHNDEIRGLFLSDSEEKNRLQQYGRLSQFAALRARMDLEHKQFWENFETSVSAAFSKEGELGDVHRNVENKSVHRLHVTDSENNVVGEWTPLYNEGIQMKYQPGVFLLLHNKFYNHQSIIMHLEFDVMKVLTT